MGRAIALPLGVRRQFGWILFLFSPRRLNLQVGGPGPTLLSPYPLCSARLRSNPARCTEVNGVRPLLIPLGIEFSLCSATSPHSSPCNRSKRSVRGLGAPRYRTCSHCRFPLPTSPLQSRS